jgi:uncharacterized protein with ParB-like and HNH nuclease domain
MTKIDAQKINLMQLFSSNFQFKIPNFQRPFSWKKDNFDKLFDSIYNAFESGQEEYFLGSIILQKQDKYANSYYIIDGQQRLVSLVVLLAVIRDKTRDEKTRDEIQDSLYQKEVEIKNLPAVPKIEMWEDLTSIENYIYKKGETCNYKRIKWKDKKDPKYSLYEAIDTFIQKYEEKFAENEKILKNFLVYLFKNVYVVCISTESLPYAIQLFRVLNTTGLPLTTADILKADNLAEIEEKERNEYSKKWREIEKRLGRENLERVIEFIRTMKLKTKAKKSLYEEYNELIFNKVLKKGKEFIEYLEKISNIYTDIILEPNELKIDSKYKAIVGLMRDYIPFDDWIPPLIAFYEKFKDYQNGRRGVNEFLYQFLVNLERKTVVEWVLGFSFTKRIESLNEVITIIEKEKDPEKIINKLDISKDEKTKTEFKMEIESSNFYYENFAKYLLLRIELEEWDLENYRGYNGKITIEHILPQNPAENSEWTKLFTEEMRKEMTDKIGNLVLLGMRKNSKAQNYDFKKKKEIYFFKGGRTPFRITNEIEKIDTWDEKSLKQRQEKMVQKLLEIYFAS